MAAKKQFSSSEIARQYSEVFAYGKSKGKPRETHGQTGNRTYISWSSMRRRCYDPDADQYYLYGGRGISVCKRWIDSFEAFYEDLGARPEGMTLDRIDPDGNYTPQNTRWADAKTQSRNRKTARMITSSDGTKRNLSEWAEKSDFSAECIAGRLDRGMGIEQATTRDRHTNRGLPTIFLEFNGSKMSAIEFSQEHCIPYSRVIKWHGQGKTACQMIERSNEIMAAREEFPDEHNPERVARDWLNGWLVRRTHISRLSGVSQKALNLRISRGWTMDEIMSVPEGKHRPGGKRPGRAINAKKRKASAK